MYILTVCALSLTFLTIAADAAPLVVRPNKSESHREGELNGVKPSEQTTALDENIAQTLTPGLENDIPGYEIKYRNSRLPYLSYDAVTAVLLESHKSVEDAVSVVLTLLSQRISRLALVKF